MKELFIYIFKETEALIKLMECDKDYLLYGDHNLDTELKDQCLCKLFTSFTAEFTIYPTKSDIRKLYESKKIPFPKHMNLVGIKKGKIKKVFAIGPAFEVEELKEHLDDVYSCMD